MCWCTVVSPLIFRILSGHLFPSQVQNPVMSLTFPKYNSLLLFFFKQELLCFDSAGIVKVDWLESQSQGCGISYL